MCASHAKTQLTPGISGFIVGAPRPPRPCAGLEPARGRRPAAPLPPVRRPPGRRLGGFVLDLDEQPPRHLHGGLLPVGRARTPVAAVPAATASPGSTVGDPSHTAAVASAALPHAAGGNPRASAISRRCGCRTAPVPRPQRRSPLRSARSHGRLPSAADAGDKAAGANRRRPPRCPVTPSREEARGLLVPLSALLLRARGRPPPATLIGAEVLAGAEGDQGASPSRDDGFFDL